MVSMIICQFQLLKNTDQIMFNTLSKQIIVKEDTQQFVSLLKHGNKLEFLKINNQRRNNPKFNFQKQKGKIIINCKYNTHGVLHCYVPTDTQNKVTLIFIAKFALILSRRNFEKFQSNPDFEKNNQVSLTCVLNPPNLNLNHPGNFNHIYIVLFRIRSL